MMQVIAQTDKEKMAMYLKQPKKKIIEMLIQCNKILNHRELSYICPSCEQTPDNPDSIATGTGNEYVADISKSLPHRCPICGGNGLVSGSFYTSLLGGTSTNITEQCRSCKGTGILWG